MKAILKTFFLLIPAFSLAQARTIDSLKHALKSKKQDTSRVQLLNELSHAYLYSRPDTALVLAQQGLALAKKAGYTKGKSMSLNGMGNVFTITGNYPKALQLRLEGLKIAEAIDDKRGIAATLGNIAVVYTAQLDYRQSIDYSLRALPLAESINFQSQVRSCLINLGACYIELNRLDSALIYTQRAYDLAVKQQDVDRTGVALTNLGSIYAKMGKDAFAVKHYRLCLPYALQSKNDEVVCYTYLELAKLFQKEGKRDSSLHYAKLSLATAQKAGFTSRVMEASSFLTEYYTAIHNIDSAFVYQSATIAAKDSLFSQEKQREIQSIGFNETIRQQQLQEAKEEAQTQLKFNMLFGGMGTLAIVAFLLLRNNWQRRKANVALQKKNDQIESTLNELKATQAQLVQSEKMASLGELTAGIAHEIQNPLNFVNNFSALNKELVAEMNEAIDKRSYDEVKAIAKDIEDNEQKILHHGTRADAIVKGMLQHSRASSGTKEPTDINALADEYLRLSYHGLKAKDKSFNANFETNFDQSIGKVQVVPQDIGRVLLNLYNNAFYAVNEKKKQLNGALEPAVEVTTKRVADKVEISVKDNGTGIPQEVLDKIFQPFFTTKPTGQGTGLGLSLSYDIIKAHGGELKVETKKGEGAEFIITLKN
jgi:signal transduction histidine kinase